MHGGNRNRGDDCPHPDYYSIVSDSNKKQVCCLCNFQISKLNYYRSLQDYFDNLSHTPNIIRDILSMTRRIGLNDSIFTIKYGEGQKFEEILDINDHEFAVEMLLKQLIELLI